MSRHHTFLIASCLGALAEMVTLWVAPRLFNEITNYASLEDAAAAGWIVGFGQVVSAVLKFLPGLLVGYLNFHQGVRTAFLAGLVGAVAYPFVLNLLPLYEAGHGPLRYFAWPTHLGYCLILGFTSAAAGGALGVVMRSNKSFERTRER